MKVELVDSDWTWLTAIPILCTGTILVSKVFLMLGAGLVIASLIMRCIEGKKKCKTKKE